MNHCQNNPSLIANVKNQVGYQKEIPNPNLAEATHSDPTQHREREQVPGFYNWNMELDFMPGVSRVVLFVSTAVLPMAMAPPYVYLYSSSPESEPQVQVTL